MIFKNRILIKLVCLCSIINFGPLFTLQANAQENSLTLAVLQEVIPEQGTADSFNVERRRWLASIREQRQKAMDRNDEISIEPLTNTCDVVEGEFSGEMPYGFFSKINTERQRGEIIAELNLP